MRIDCFNPEEASACGGLKEKGRIVISAVQKNSTRGVLIVFITLLFLTVLIYSRWFDDVASFIGGGNINRYDNHPHRRQPSKTPVAPIILSCPAQSRCRKTTSSSISLPPSPSLSPSALPSLNTTTDPSPFPSPSCPDFFRYIHEDLKPWNSTGITKGMVESARRFANFRLAVIGGRAYLEQYSKAFQTRDVFTIWGILQLLNRYPGRVPDFELMFNCDDPPTVKAKDYHSSAPPPLFRYCKDESTLDIVFPDWSFWGWSELKIKPWNLFIEEIKNASKRLKWSDREPYAYWKGNPWVAGTRQDLLRCNVSNGHEWNARLFIQNWDKEIQNGFKQSNLADQCNYRYKIYIEGRSWSVSEKYILACDSPTLFVTTRFIDFFTRSLVPGQHYWPIRTNQKCKSIKFAVEWGNKHQKQAQNIGRAASLFTQEELSMENVYDYMLHLLTEYAKLLKYKPTIPEKATEICIESMACPASGLVKTFMLDSMVKSTYEYEPCSLPPPFDQKELDEISRSKEKNIREIEIKEDGWKL